MTNYRGAIGAACLALWAMQPALSHAQKLGTPAARQLIVETSYLYTRYPYAEAIGFTANKDLPAVEQAGPEMALARYLTALARGQVNESLAAWTADSQKLIRKKNSSISESELRQSMVTTNNGVRFDLLARVVYGDYVMIEIVPRPQPGQPKPETDSYALKKVGLAWLLTQELADDPVMCCRDSGQQRIRRVGVPGGDFRRVLEAMNR
jgi:hypothetical protein